MLTLVQRSLLKLPPEMAHHRVISLLKSYQWLNLKAGRVPAPKVSIHIPSVPTLKFSSRLGLAAGFDKNAEVFAALSYFGFGFIEVGTVTPKPQEGNPKPRIWRVSPHSLINSLGFNNCGLVQFRENILRYRSRVKIPLFANIGKGKETPNESAVKDYAAGVGLLHDCVDGFVVNISSPNTPGLRLLQSAEFIEKIAAIMPPGTPVWLKLAPDLANEDLKELCAQVAVNSRFAGVVLTNTSRALAEKAGSPVGGFSGPALLQRSLECVALAREILPESKTIIGVGGVTSPDAAKKMRETGADLVEIYTSFIYGGPAIVPQLSAAIDDMV